jgi:DNA-binding transcriptional regulator YiaG
MRKLPKNLKCECGGTFVPRIRDVIDLAPIMGLEGHTAMVKDAGVLVCNRCSEVMLDSGLLDAARANMAAMGCLRPSRLTPQLARLCRDLLGVTQEELASRMGITRVTVARWETNTHPISPQLDFLLRGFVAAHLAQDRPGLATQVLKHLSAVASAPPAPKEPLVVKGADLAA